MRKIPEAMQKKLDEGATTFCACWRIDPNGAAPLGFTEHDADIVFDGVTYEASSGFEASAIERSLGLAIDNTAVNGALRSDRITEADIQRGRYDGAEFRLWLVDWTDPSSRLLTFRGEIGEISRGVVAFEAEIRGLSEKLNRPVGRRYLGVCDALLGDGRCGVDSSRAKFRKSGAVSRVLDVRTIEVTGLKNYEPGWFDFGVLKWTGGENAGSMNGIRSHRFQADAITLELDRDLVDAPLPGDAFEVTAGCDKRLSTCREKFANVINFRGFPYTPGESWLTAYPVEGGVYQGGSRGRG